MPETETLERRGAVQDVPDTEISVRHLTKRFGKQTVLEDISCDIPKGKITLMLGPSGTGKSVFLKNIMGLLRPEAGEIWIAGKNVPKLRQKELYAIRRKFGVLFQDGALFGSMSVYDNTAFPLREHTRKGEREIRDIVMEKLEMVGLIGAEGKLPGQISGGMKKRAGLARALVLDPEIIMFDEPDSGLDPVRTAFLNELILDLNKKLGSTMLVVTHDIATARRVADYIGMLYLRNLVAFGSKEAMFNSDTAVVRQFLAGATEGPIGMSEEADEGRQPAQSSYGLSAAETEALERQAGAPAEESEAAAIDLDHRAEEEATTAARRDTLRRRARRKARSHREGGPDQREGPDETGAGTVVETDHLSVVPSRGENQRAPAATADLDRDVIELPGRNKQVVWDREAGAPADAGRANGQVEPRPNIWIRRGEEEGKDGAGTKATDQGDAGSLGELFGDEETEEG